MLITKTGGTLPLSVKNENRNYEEYPVNATLANKELFTVFAP